jgi:hypothetical protein
MKPDEQQQSNTVPEPAVAAELRALVQKAKAGDVTALPRMRAILAEHPEIWQTAGDLERVVVRSWAELLGGDDPFSIEAVRRKAEQLRHALEGDDPTALERLLVGQVVSGWLETTYAQIQLAQPGGAALGQAGFDLKRAEQAHKRYLAAMRTLAMVRELLPRGLLPASQVRLHEQHKKLA